MLGKNPFTRVKTHVNLNYVSNIEQWSCDCIDITATKNVNSCGNKSKHLSETSTVI